MNKKYTKRCTEAYQETVEHMSKTLKKETKVFSYIYGICVTLKVVNNESFWSVRVPMGNNKDLVVPQNTEKEACKLAQLCAIGGVLSLQDHLS